MYYIHDRYVDTHQAVLPILDLGLLRGCAVFDYLRTYQGRCFHLDEHLKRLRYSAEQLDLKLPYPLATIKEIVLETKRRNPFEEASIKILITGGISSDQFTPSEQTHLIVLVYPLSAQPDIHFTEGISTITTPLSRCLPTSKTTQYIPGIVALQKGKPLQAKEALYLNGKGEILEGVTSNFFAFKQGILYTCDSEEILFGITRAILLRLVQHVFPVILQPIHIQELTEIDEAFITASNKEIMPVVQIDGIPIGKHGRIGTQTSQIMELFRSYTKQAVWPPLEIPRYEAKRVNK